MPEPFQSANMSQVEKGKERMAAAAAARLLQLNRNISNDSASSNEETIYSKLKSGFYISMGIGAMSMAILIAALIAYIRRPGVGRLVQLPPGQIDEAMVNDLEGDDGIATVQHLHDEEPMVSHQPHPQRTNASKEAEVPLQDLLMKSPTVIPKSSHLAEAMTHLNDQLRAILAANDIQLEVSMDDIRIVSDKEEDQT
jgi:hypothetical protein